MKHHHPPEAFAEALASLDAAGLVRLDKMQRKFSRPPFMDRTDLLQEVHVRVLSGTRPWPLEVSVVNFATQVMRSIADEASERSGRERLRSVASQRIGGRPGPAAGIAGRSGEVLLLHPPTTPEDELLAAGDIGGLKEWHQAALDEFAGDYDAQVLMEGLLEGYKGKALQELTGLGDTAFASKQRNVRRGLERLTKEMAERGR